jgi:hypothetical protein
MARVMGRTACVDPFTVLASGVEWSKVIQIISPSRWWHRCKSKCRIGDILRRIGMGFWAKTAIQLCDGLGERSVDDCDVDFQNLVHAAKIRIVLILRCQSSKYTRETFGYVIRMAKGGEEEGFASSSGAN